LKPPSFSFPRPVSWDSKRSPGMLRVGLIEIPDPTHCGPLRRNVTKGGYRSGPVIRGLRWFLPGAEVGDRRVWVGSALKTDLGARACFSSISGKADSRRDRISQSR
jgi:hypothetical protein